MNEYQGQFGATDCGKEYIIKWFENHKCNKFCNKHWIKAKGIVKSKINSKQRTSYTWEIAKPTHLMNSTTHHTHGSQHTVVKKDLKSINSNKRHNNKHSHGKKDDTDSDSDDSKTLSDVNESEINDESDGDNDNNDDNNDDLNEYNQYSSDSYVCERTRDNTWGDIDDVSNNKILSKCNERVKELITH